MANYEKLDSLRYLTSRLNEKGDALRSISTKEFSFGKVPIVDPSNPRNVIAVIDTVDIETLKRIIYEQNDTIILLQQTIKVLLDGII